MQTHIIKADKRIRIFIVPVLSCLFSEILYVIINMNYKIIIDFPAIDIIHFRFLTYQLLPWQLDEVTPEDYYVINGKEGD